MTNFKEALNLEMKKNDAGAKTVREYFHILLSKLWAEAEGFSGKRPFGNGSWQYDLYEVLITNGFIEGKLDEDGYVDTLNHKTADAYIQELIKFMCLGEK
jgi:hypothetical protein